MTTSFSIDYEWLSSENGDGDSANRSTLAELTINVGQWCVTEVEDTFAKTVRSSARLSALKLAEWFAINWWRLLWEPQANTYSWRSSHKVGNAGGGYGPDLSFSELRRYLGDEMPTSDDVHDAAAYFDASPLMIQTMLVNKRVLSRESLDDWVT